MDKAAIRCKAVVLLLFDAPFMCGFFLGSLFLLCGSWWPFLVWQSSC